MGGASSSPCTVGGGASLSKAGRGGAASAASAAAPHVTLLLRHRPSNSLWHSPAVPPMQARLPQSSRLSPAKCSVPSGQVQEAPHPPTSLEVAIVAPPIWTAGCCCCCCCCCCCACACACCACCCACCSICCWAC